MLNEGMLTPLYDERMVAEYTDVLRREKFGLSLDVVNALIDNLRLHGIAVHAESLDLQLPDPSDLPFLEVAAAGNGDYLVTGNEKHYKPVRGSHTIAVISPTDFIAKLTG
jgi:predicted nucleic acid-binding protein